jgi:hypothetical protein
MLSGGLSGHIEGIRHRCWIVQQLQICASYRIGSKIGLLFVRTLGDRAEIPEVSGTSCGRLSGPPARDKVAPLMGLIARFVG